MKRAFTVFFLFTFLFISSPMTYAEAAEIQIKIDGVAIVSDMKPEIKNNRTMVPLRVISENLGASIEWSKSEVVLTKSDLKVTLRVNNDTAEKNGEKMLLDAKPYMKNNRIFVPLRFIAETFGCKVNYRNLEVTIDTIPLKIDGAQVKALQQEYHMTMGGVVQQIYGNAYNETIYKIIVENKGERVEAPANYSWRVNLDIPGSYYKNAQYDFLDGKGNSLVRFDVYSLVEAFPSELISGYTKVLIQDVSSDTWYLFSDTANQAIGQLIETAAIISNTVV